MDKKNQKFGGLLLDEKLVTQKQIDTALKIQTDERAKLNKFSLSEYLVEKGIVDEKQLKTLETKFKLNHRLGESLVADGIITQDQLNSVLAEKKEHQFLGEILLKKRLIDKSQLYEYLKQQHSLPSFQAVLIQEKLLSENRIKEITVENTLPRSLGEILVNHGAITAQKLNKALKKHKKRRPIGGMLVETGLISQEQLELALVKQKFSSASLSLLGNHLIGEGILSDVEFGLVLSRQFAMGFKILDGKTLQGMDFKKLRKIISQKDSKRYRVLPLSFKNEILNLALFNPMDVERLEGFESIINFKITLTLIRECDFKALYEKLYDEPPNWEEMCDDFKNVIEDTMDISLVEQEKSEGESMYVAADKDKEAEKLVNLITSYGIQLGASDIHVENDVKGIHIRFRVDGMLRELKDPMVRNRVQKKALHIISRIKVMANLNIAERRLPQDGSFRISVLDNDSRKKVNLDFRVAICRGTYGENVVMRILDSRKANVRLDQLAHSMDLLNSLVKLLNNTGGIFLVTGPTGSGKSSTLYAALHYLNHPERKILTAEDPVEFKVPGLMQSQVHPKIGLDFARLLRSFLRMDPDVIMLGEIRDRETAGISMEAAMTGHLVLSSMHTGDAIGSISRLRDLGVSNLQICTSLKGAMAQRLVRKICESCIQPYMPETAEWNYFFPEEPVHLKFFKGEGCGQCNHTGYSGRIAISELFLLTPAGQNIISGNGDEDAIYATAKLEGMKTMVEDGLNKLDRTTLPELSRTLPPESVERFREEYMERYSMFPKFQLPDNSSIEYQMLLSKSKKGFSLERVHELFAQFRNLKKRLKEPTDHMKEKVFTKFLEEKLHGLGGSNGMGEYRVTLLKRGKRPSIMVESAYRQ